MIIMTMAIKSIRIKIIRVKTRYGYSLSKTYVKLGSIIYVLILCFVSSFDTSLIQISIISLTKSFLKDFIYLKMDVIKISYNKLI